MKLEFDKFKVGKLGSGKNCRIAVREGVILHPMGRGVGTSYSTRWGKRGVSYFTKWVWVGCSMLILHHMGEELGSYFTKRVKVGCSYFTIWGKRGTHTAPNGGRGGLILHQVGEGGMLHHKGKGGGAHTSPSG